MASANRLLKLSRIIATETQKIESFLAKNGIQQPSLNPSGPLDFPVPSSNKEIQASRRAVLSASKELQDLIAGPRETIRWMAWSYNDNLSLSAINHFKIAQAVSLDGTTPYASIAKQTNLSEPNVKRIIRHGITNRIFCEPNPAHTTLSRVLLEDNAMQGWVGLITEDFFPAAAHTIEAMKKYPNSEEPGEAGFTVAHRHEGSPMFKEIGKDPVRARRFGGAMNSLTGGEGYEVKLMVDGYSWGDIGKGTVVDVGGSYGFACVALAHQFPDLTFVVQDLPKMVAIGPSKTPPELLDRITFQAYDFFTPQPVKNADVYFFRWIFHNWSDKYCLKILENLIPSLKPGSKIVINDICLPVPGEEDPWDEKVTRTMDLTMLQLLNARERDGEDYVRLFKLADERFRVSLLKRPAGSRIYIIEVTWDG